MLRLVSPRRLAVAAFVFCLAAAGQVRAQSAQSFGSPQGVIPSAQGYVAAVADTCGDTGPHFKLPKLGHGKTVCTIPAGTVCEPAKECHFKMPKVCLPKIHMPKVCLPKIKMPSLCHKKACDTGCGGGCGGEVWAGTPVAYPSAQGYASPQGIASPQG